MAATNAWTPKLGLDLRGGTTITLTARNSTGQGGVDQASLEQARTIIQQRVDSMGVGESEVTTVGGNQITVSVPNVAPDQLREMVGQTAQLYFRPVYQMQQATPAPQPAEPSASPSANRRPAPGLPTPAPSPRPTAPAAKQPTVAEAMAWQPTQRDLADFAAYQCGEPFPDVTDQPLITCDRERTAKYLLGPVIVRGDQLTDAQAGILSGGVSWTVSLQFNGEGAAKFEEATRMLSQPDRQEPQNQFAIVLDSDVISAPRVNEAIAGGRAQITGDFNQASATDLANVLKYGALPLSFELSESANVSPTLGGEQLRAGLIGGAVGLALVALYAIAYYQGLSIVIIASLALCGLITYALLVLLGQSMGLALNLPGIAGAILAIGVTADSFIIYFERIRDEVRDGRSLSTAIETGWIGSRKTILVADAVSLLSALVLFILAIGSVKGFAFTLGLTTVVDILIVFFFTKPLVTLLGRTKFFGEGRRFSGFEADHLGAEQRGRRTRRLSATTAKEA
ncbi:protein translocase subunit SecD [Nigerium massiliense]|uniref:protein translocase subunit SecD n=1 Tax=Nigerium massiliense TaxID=1522317 RepID=UPI000694B5B8